MEQLLSNSEIQQATVEIKMLKQQTARNIIEIGKRLKEVKDQLPHGDFTNWLYESVDFTARTARRFIQAYEQFGKGTTSTALAPSQLFEVLSLPESVDRQQFIENPHTVPSTGETKTVDEMTVRELREVKRTLRDIEQKAKELEEQNVSLIERSRTIREENEELKRQKNPEPKVVEVAPADLLQENQEMNTRIAQLTGEMDSIRADYHRKLQDVQDGDRKAQMRELKRLLQEQLKAVGWNHSAALFLYQQLDGNKEASQYLHDFLNDYEQVVRQQINDWHNAMTLNTEEEITTCKTI